MIAAGLLVLLAFLTILASLRDWFSTILGAGAWGLLMLLLAANLLLAPPSSLAPVMIGCAFLLTLLVISLYLVDPLQRRRRARYLADRETLSDDQIYTRFYADSGLEPRWWTEAWHEVAAILHVAPGLLRPDDPLARLNGVPPRVFGRVGDVARLINRVRNEAFGRFPLPAKMETLDDIVRHLAEHSAEYDYPEEKRTRYAGDQPEKTC
jgi:hypothetical protein